MRLKLAAVGLDETRERVVVAAPSRREQARRRRLPLGHGLPRFPVGGLSGVASARSRAPGRSEASTAATTIATAMSSAAIANARW